MEHLTKLFTLLELSRNIPQYGYGLAGISKAEQSDIAQHQYLTTLIAWQLARSINRKGGNVNIQRVTESALVHDLGELLGGDINFYYGRSNSEAREKAKAFESENAKFLSTFFERDKDYYYTLFEEFENGTTDEALVAKSADLIECLHYKQQVGKIAKDDLAETTKTIQEFCDQMKNLQNGLLLKKFISSWSEQFGKETPIEILTNSTN